MLLEIIGLGFFFSTRCLHSLGIVSLLNIFFSVLRATFIKSHSLAISAVALEGFLSTEDSSLPGNLGLKDQTLALRWVQDNIRDLGGDPDEVTLFGQGSGAQSVHYQILTPYSRGTLFRVVTNYLFVYYSVNCDMHRVMRSTTAPWSFEICGTGYVTTPELREIMNYYWFS